MTYEMYRYVYIIAAGISGVLLLISVFLFFKWNVRKIVGNLTGRTAKKEINIIRRSNEGFESKRVNAGAIHRNEDKVTDKISTNELTQSPSYMQVNNAIEQSKTEELHITNETTLLEPWHSYEQEVAAGCSMAGNETTLLEQAAEKQQNVEVERDITFIHTDEIIT